MMLDLKKPSNVNVMINIIILVVNAELIDPDWSTAFVFDFEPDLNYVENAFAKGKTGLLSVQINELGFQSYNPVYNMGGLFVMIFVVLGQLVFFTVLHTLTYKMSSEERHEGG